jgi:rhomboid protease GluP
VIVWIVIGINVLVWLAHVTIFGVNPSNPKPIDLLMLGGNVFEATKMQPWRLLTSMFMHAGVAHLAWNMVALIQLGSLAHRFYGTAGFAVLYIGAGLGGALLSLKFGAAQAVSVGASGAIFGLLGAIVASAMTKRQAMGKENAKGLMVMGAVYVAFNVFVGFTTPGIDNAAHLGGLITGALIAVGLAEKFDRMEFATNATKRLLGTTAITVIALAALWFFIFGKTA